MEVFFEKIFQNNYGTFLHKQAKFKILFKFIRMDISKLLNLKFDLASTKYRFK
jgi:hypothetical protein